MSIFEFIVKLQLVKGIPELFLREPYKMQDTRNRYAELQELTSLPPLCFAFGYDMFLMIIATLTQKIHSLHSLPTNSSQNHPSP